MPVAIYLLAFVVVDTLLSLTFLPDHVAVLDALAALGIGGGRTYDALIAAAASHAKADELLTFNVRHFEKVSGGMAVVEP